MVADRLTDEVDMALLRSLSDDARMSIAALADRHHISRATAYTRLQRLRSEGIIEKFTIAVNPEKIGIPLSALVLLVTVREVPFAWDAAGPVLASLPEVEFAGELSGEFDAFLFARFRDAEHLKEFLSRAFQSIPGVGRSRTYLVLNLTQGSVGLMPHSSTVT